MCLVIFCWVCLQLTIFFPGDCRFGDLGISTQSVPAKRAWDKPGDTQEFACTRYKAEYPIFQKVIRFFLSLSWVYLNSILDISIAHVWACAHTHIDTVSCLWCLEYFRMECKLKYSYCFGVIFHKLCSLLESNFLYLQFIKPVIGAGAFLLKKSVTIIRTACT